MSIESNLKTLTENTGRIANALEKIADNFAMTNTVIAGTSKDTPAPAPGHELLTDEVMNVEMVKEFNRLGSRDQIDAEMKNLGVAGVTGLDAEMQSKLLTAVRAIPNG